MSAPGWYPDPNGQPYQRWWDGTQWSDQTQQPAQTQQQQQPPPQPQQAPPGWQQPPAQPGYPMPYAQTVPMSPEQARQWAMFAHLSALLSGFIGLPFLGPLIIYLTKKDEDPFVADQAREALNFTITLMIALFVCVILIFVIIGIFLIFVVAIGGIVFQIIAAVQANKGVWYRYPLNIRFINA